MGAQLDWRAPIVATLPLDRPRLRSALAVVRAYVALTKPRIIELLLVTTLPTMVVAAHRWPSWGTVGATLVGGTLSAGSANTFNCYLDRDIDARMRRTARRPLVGTTGVQLRPRRALAFGVILAAGSTLWMAELVNGLAALLCAAAVAFYVFIYTLLLKRRTPQNIVIGGAAGAFPVLVGWAAVTGSVGATAWALAAVVLLWTPPHFWALAIRFRDDYAAAGVPMMPVVRPAEVVARQITAYSYATVASSLLVAWVAGLGFLYIVAAVGLGAVLLRESHALGRRLRLASPARSLRLFRFSIVYLGLLFVAAGADRLLPR